MGKTGKHRKRVRLLRERELGSAVHTLQSSALPARQQAVRPDVSQDAEGEVLDALELIGITPDDLSVVVKTLGAIGGNVFHDQQQIVQSRRRCKDSAKYFCIHFNESFVQDSRKVI